MSDRDLRDRPQTPREGDNKPPPESDARAPMFGRWGVWYLLVALDLLVVILICAWITHPHP